jgi:DNA (cytosine-5)-methyltransferase 1
MGRYLRDHARMSADMGIDWMTDRELKESIPPAYTEWIGAQLLRAIGAAA